jgi:hypothetical protein
LLVLNLNWVTNRKQFEETFKIGSIGNTSVQITSKTFGGEYHFKSKKLFKSQLLLKKRNYKHIKIIFEDELTILKLLTLANPQKNSIIQVVHDSLHDME